MFIKTAIIIIFVFIYYFYNLSYNEKFDNIWLFYHNGKPRGGIGNIISVFYFKKIVNFVYKKNNTNFISNKFEYYNNYKLLNKSFNLSDKKIKEIEPYISKNSFDDGTSFWNICNYKKGLVPIHNLIYNEIKVSLNLFLNNVKTPEIEKIPILHFRCSDVPFKKHISYNFSKYKFYKLCNDKLKKKYNKWYIMHYSKHLADNKKRNYAEIYRKDLIKYLEDELELKIEVLTPNKEIEDLKLLHSAPAVISGGCGGSFSFFGGYFNNEFFFTDNNYKSNNDNEVVNLSLKHQNYYPGFRLSHSTVEKNGGYENTKEIFKLLRK